MFAKVLAISALVAYAQAGVIGLAQPSIASSYSSINQHNLGPVAALQAGPLAYARSPIVQAGVIGLAQPSLASSYSSVNRHNFAPITALQAGLLAYARSPVVQAGVIGVAQRSVASSYSSVNQNNLAPIAALQAGPLAYAQAPVARLATIPRLAPVAQYAAPIAHLGHAAPLVKAVHQEVYAHPQYFFNYGVQDAHTGDAKNQQETRDGDVVKGEYSLVQPDGVTRTVHYSADDHNGFVAQVSYSGHAGHPQLVQKAVVAKTLVGSPLLHQAPVLSSYIH